MSPLNPARLNVLLGAIRVIVLSAAASLIEAIGICGLPSSTRSQWISSEQITRSFCTLISTIASSSVCVNVRPIGLKGLQSIKSLEFPAEARSRAFHGKLPCPCLIGHGKTLQLASLVLGRSQKKDGKPGLQ